MDKTNVTDQTVTDVNEPNDQEFLSILGQQFGLSDDELKELQSEIATPDVVENPTTEQPTEENPQTEVTEDKPEDKKEPEGEKVDEKPRQDSKTNKAFKEYRQKLELKEKQMKDILEAFGVDPTDENAVSVFFANLNQFKVQKRAEQENKKPEEVLQEEKLSTKEQEIQQRERNLALKEIKLELISDLELTSSEVDEFIDELEAQEIDVLKSKLTPVQLFKALKSDVLERKREEKRKAEEEAKREQRILENTPTPVRQTANSNVEDMNDDMTYFNNLLKNRGLV